MPKYEIYQLGKLPPLTVVEAKTYWFDENGDLAFGENTHKSSSAVAVFNWRNIAGFKKIKE